MRHCAGNMLLLLLALLLAGHVAGVSLLLLLLLLLTDCWLSTALRVCVSISNAMR